MKQGKMCVKSSCAKLAARDGGLDEDLRRPVLTHFLVDFAFMFHKI